MDLLVIGGLARRQVFQLGPLLVDALGVASVAATDGVMLTSAFRTKMTFDMATKKFELLAPKTSTVMSINASQT